MADTAPALPVPAQPTAAATPPAATPAAGDKPATPSPATMASSLLDRAKGAASKDATPADASKDASKDAPTDPVEFKVDGNQLFDPHVLKAFGGSVTELGIDPKVAQTLLDRVAPVVQERMVQAAVEREKVWADEVIADKELGGANLDATLASIDRALAKIGSPDLVELLNRSGLGSNIHVARALVQVDRAITPRALNKGTPPPATKPGPKTLAEALYG